MYSNGYSYRREFTIDNTKVIGASDFTDFTILVNLTNASIKDTANGGKVTSSAGNDIRFETTGGTKLAHEIERYDNVNGQLIAWVKIPTLATASDTDFYMYYGRSGVAAEQDPTNAWNSDYKAVVHMKGAAGTDTLGNLGITESGVDYSTNDYIADEGTFDGNDHITGSNTIANAANFTILMFVQSTDNVPENKYLTRDEGGGTNWGLFVGQFNGHYIVGVQTSTGWQAFETATNVNTGAHDMITTTFDGTDLVISQNKTEIGNDAPTGTIKDTANKNIVIGALNSTTQRTKARIDEVRFLLVAVSDDWRDTTHNANDYSTFWAMGSEEYDDQALLIDLFTVDFESGEVASERDAVLQGQDTSSSERDAVLQGQTTDSSERDAVTQGQDTSSSERDSVLSGQHCLSTDLIEFTFGEVEQNVASERDAVLQGELTDDDERDAVLHGQASANDERDAVLHGTDTDDDERGAVLQGQLTDDDERDAVLNGQDGTNDERDAVLHGTTTAADERDAVLTGEDDTADERDAVLQGTTTNSDERDAVLQGELTTADERDATLHGQVSDSSERDAVLQGQDAAASERDAVLQGQDTSSSERSAVLQGEVTANSERDIVLQGQLSTSDERDATLHGEQSTSSERDIVLQGADTTSSERGATLTGVRVDIPFICVGVRSLQGKITIRHRCLGVVITAMRGKVTFRKLQNCVAIEKVDPTLTIRRK